jgi:hypothetical protein
VFFKINLGALNGSRGVGKNSRVLFISTTTTGFSLETKISSELIQPCIESGQPSQALGLDSLWSFPSVCTMGLAPGFALLHMAGV